MKETNPKRRLYEQFAAIARALGHPHKLELLELLAQREHSVEALSKAAGISVANTSQHLQQLRRSGLVTSRKDGLYVYYRVAADDVIELLGGLRKTGRRHVSELDNVIFDYFNDRDSLEVISRQELLQRTRDGRVTILDVRPVEEFEAGHIPGAVNVPLEDLEQSLAEIPEDQQVVAYCRGEFCVFAYEAVAALRKKGIVANRLEEGFPEWKAAGLPVDREPS